MLLVERAKSGKLKTPLAAKPCFSWSVISFVPVGISLFFLALPFNIYFLCADCDQNPFGSMFSFLSRLPSLRFVFLFFWSSESSFFFQCNAQEGLEGNPSAGTIKNVSRGFAALSIPFTAGFPKVHVATSNCARLCIICKACMFMLNVKDTHHGIQIIDFLIE